MTRILTAGVLVFSAVGLLFAGQERPGRDSVGPFALATPPIDVTYCQLTRDPGAYNKKRIRLTAFVTFGFEDFTIVDPKCTLPDRLSTFSVWVTYAGDVNSGAIYCCPGEGPRRPQALRID